ncbi:hypothetical protein BDF22DRAFT_778449 [Syncephalis plumigaleata]|nr:hypothetical protein BDF22DRAFT_778449 [Syncephalis plumigaleata]
MSTSITTDRRYVYRASSSSSASSVSSVLTAPSLSHSREPGVMASATSNTASSEQQEENSRNPFRSTCEHSELIAPPPAYVDAANVPPPPYVAVDMSLPTPADTSQTAATTRSMPTDADWTNTTTTATRNGVEHNNKALDDALDDLCFCCSVLQCIDLLFACCIGLAK